MAAAFHLHSRLPGTKGTGNRQWRKQQAKSSKYQARGSLQLTEMPSRLQNKTLQDSISKLLQRCPNVALEMQQQTFKKGIWLTPNCDKVQNITKKLCLKQFPWSTSAFCMPREWTSMTALKFLAEITRFGKRSPDSSITKWMGKNNTGDFSQRFPAFNQIKKLSIIQNPVVDTSTLQCWLGSHMDRFWTEWHLLIWQRRCLATNWPCLTMSTFFPSLSKSNYIRLDFLEFFFFFPLLTTKLPFFMLRYWSLFFLENWRRGAEALAPAVGLSQTSSQTHSPPPPTGPQQLEQGRCWVLLTAMTSSKGYL